MKFRTIIEILKGSNIKLPLGRWNKHNYSQTVLKIKYANEDNCGFTCDNFTPLHIHSADKSAENEYKKVTGLRILDAQRRKNIENNNINNNINKESDDNDKYIYMMGYESVH